MCLIRLNWGRNFGVETYTPQAQERVPGPGLSLAAGVRPLRWGISGTSAAGIGPGRSCRRGRRAGSATRGFGMAGPCPCWLLGCSWRTSLLEVPCDPGREPACACVDGAAKVFGGTQHNGNFSYTSDLWNFSLLQSSWTPLATESPVPRPRRGHAASWDPDSRTLLIFAGFDGRYRDDLWRYSAVGARDFNVSLAWEPDVLVVECAVGQACAMQARTPLPTTGRFAVSGNCSQTQFLVGLPSSFVEFEGSTLSFVNSSSTTVLAEPGKGKGGLKQCKVGLGLA